MRNNRGKDQRVVITGVGAVTALGHTIEDTFDALCHGRSGIVEIDYLKKAGFPVYIGGAVPDTDKLLDKHPDAHHYGSRKLAYILEAFEQALLSSGLPESDLHECGLYMGIESSRVPFSSSFRIFHLAGRQANRVDYNAFGRLCRNVVSPSFVQNKLPSFIPRYLADRYGISGPLLATSNACASSNYAIGEALRQLRRGRVQVVITGSTDEMLDEYMITGFTRLKALSLHNEEPGRALRPFDVGRDGFVLGEGAAVLVLETLEHALKRSAPILCELAGYATTSDGEKITACNRKGTWLSVAMKRCIEDGGLTLDDIDYISAHGTSTRLNDLSESRAITALFGYRTHSVLVNATKSMIGHTVAAAGAIEAAVTALTLYRGVCHPTLNLEIPDKGCELNYCVNGAVRKQFRAALSNACGFSGGNSCLSFRRFEQ